MEDFNTKIPLLKKVDRAIFEKIDKFKTTSNYNIVQDFYNGLEEEQQKVFKGFVILFIFLIPALGLFLLTWQNNQLRNDLEMRVQIVNKANEIVGQTQGLRDVLPQIVSQNPIDSSSMMTSRMSNLLSAMNIDLSKIQVKDFSSDSISSGVLRAEADFSFSNVSTDELMNIFISMIQREKFRIQAVEINRNSSNDMLQGQFHAIHYSSIAGNEEE